MRTIVAGIGPDEARAAAQPFKPAGLPGLNARVD